MLRIITCMCLFFLTSSAFAQQVGRSGLKHEQLGFKFQELLEPYASYECKHIEDGAGASPLDWLVYCKVGRKVMVYAVHLAVSRYGRTQYGQSAYEVLYWVTDRSQENTRAYDSSTIWFHQNQAESRATVLELSQGIQNDLAALRLVIHL